MTIPKCAGWEEGGSKTLQKEYMTVPDGYTTQTLLHKNDIFFKQ